MDSEGQNNILTILNLSIEKSLFPGNMLRGSIGASFVTSWQPSGEADIGSYIRFWQLPLFRCLNMKKMDRTRKEGL